MRRLLVLVAILMCVDGVMTHQAVTAGLAREWNSLVAPVAGDWQFMLFKAIGATVCVIALWNVHRHVPVLARIGANCVAGFYVAVLSWNFSVLFTA